MGSDITIDCAEKVLIQKAASWREYLFSTGGLVRQIDWLRNTFPG
jgi:hypothetical protein